MKPKGGVAYFGYIVIGKPKLWCQAPVIIFVELGYFYLSQYVYKDRSFVFYSENLFLSSPPILSLEKRTVNRQKANLLVTKVVRILVTVLSLLLNFIWILSKSQRTEKT